MRKTVVAFLTDRRQAIVVDCPGDPPDAPSYEEFQAEARRALVAQGAFTEEEAARAKFVVQD